jgi:flagellar protein FlbD
VNWFLKSFEEMINLTRLNHEDFVVNADLIELIETTPDTVLTMTTGHRIMVRETPPEVVGRVLAFRHRIAAGPALSSAPAE